MASGQGQGIFATTSCLILLLLMIEGAGCQPRPSNRRPIPNEAIFDVTNFNAKGDGKTDNAMVNLISVEFFVCFKKIYIYQT